MPEPSGTVSTPPVEGPTELLSPTEGPTELLSPTEGPTELLSPTEGPAEPTAPAVGQIAMVYIGTKAGGFPDYPMTYDGELTPEKLIQ